jgi:hypothetical protein
MTQGLKEGIGKFAKVTWLPSVNLGRAFFEGAGRGTDGGSR